MIEFDPGPNKALTRHLAAMPSYAEQRELFWYDWGPIFYRGRLNGSARLVAIASDPGPTEPRAARWWAMRGKGCRASWPSWD